MIENRLVGVKSRECYEVPAGARAHPGPQGARGPRASSGKCCITSSASSRAWATAVYNGQWFSPLKEAHRRVHRVHPALPVRHREGSSSTRAPARWSAGRAPTRSTTTRWPPTTRTTRSTTRPPRASSTCRRSPARPGLPNRRQEGAPADALRRREGSRARLKKGKYEAIVERTLGKQVVAERRKPSWRKRKETHGTRGQAGSTESVERVHAALRRLAAGRQGAAMRRISPARRAHAAMLAIGGRHRARPTPMPSWAGSSACRSASRRGHVRLRHQRRGHPYGRRAARSSRTSAMRARACTRAAPATTRWPPTRACSRKQRCERPHGGQRRAAPARSSRQAEEHLGRHHAGLHAPAARPARAVRSPYARLRLDARPRLRAPRPPPADAADASPLGAAALAGTTYPLDRQMTAASLGFVARDPQLARCRVRPRLSARS